jgi:hypothetical protein
MGKAKYLTNQQVKEKNMTIRDGCISWILDVVGMRQEEMLEKGKSNAIVQMYNTACQEIKRCEEIDAVRATNSGMTFVFEMPTEPPARDAKSN